MLAIGIYRGKTEVNLGTLWRAAHLFGADLLFTIGHRYVPQASDTTKAWHSIPLINYPDLEAFQAARPFDAPLIGVELHSQAKPLAKLRHPRSAVYLLGAEDNGLSREAIQACDQLVQIEAANPMSMNVAMAGSLILYARHLQREVGVAIQPAAQAA